MALNESPDRYAAQKRFAPLGEEGQKRLAKATVLIVGCGGLGMNSANLLARAGVGRLRIIDPDKAELSNLHRQVLLDERDAEKARPKALAARARLEAANSSAAIEHFIDRLDGSNIAKVSEGVDLIVDATDNLDVRLIVNGHCARSGIPWIYGGAVGSFGMAMAILPGRGPCLKCVFGDSISSPGLPTSLTHGVIGPAPAAVSAIQCGQALRLLAGEDFEPELAVIDVWDLSLRTVKIERNPQCPACGKKS